VRAPHAKDAPEAAVAVMQTGTESTSGNPKETERQGVATEGVCAGAGKHELGDDEQPEPAADGISAELIEYRPGRRVQVGAVG